MVAHKFKECSKAPSRLKKIGDTRKILKKIFKHLFSHIKDYEKYRSELRILFCFSDFSTIQNKMQ